MMLLLYTLILIYIALLTIHTIPLWSSRQDSMYPYGYLHALVTALHLRYVYLVGVLIYMRFCMAARFLNYWLWIVLGECLVVGGEVWRVGVKGNGVGFLGLVRLWWYL